MIHGLQAPFDKARKYMGLRFISSYLRAICALKLTAFDVVYDKYDRGELHHTGPSVR